MDDTCDACAVLLAKAVKGRGNRFLFGEIDRQEREIRLFTRFVETNDRVGVRQRRSERTAYIACSTGDEDNWFGVFAHHVLEALILLSWTGILLERSRDRLVPACSKPM